jgi:ATP-dependent protease Clp ATPase subunit
MFGKVRLACSFCGKNETEVNKLVAGPKVFICDECVSIASRIMSDHDAGKTPEPGPQFGKLRRVLDRMKRALRPNSSASILVSVPCRG